MRKKRPGFYKQFFTVLELYEEHEITLEEFKKHLINLYNKAGTSYINNKKSPTVKILSFFEDYIKSIKIMEEFIELCTVLKKKKFPRQELEFAYEKAKKNYKTFNVNYDNLNYIYSLEKEVNPIFYKDDFNKEFEYATEKAKKILKY